MTIEPCARCGERPAIEGHILCAGCEDRQGPLSPEEGRRYRARLRADWPVHQPEAFDAPIPGRQWYAGCEPGGDYDPETRTYAGTGPRVDPSTGICESCGAVACPTCGRENCPDHSEQAVAT